MITLIMFIKLIIINQNVDVVFIVSKARSFDNEYHFSIDNIAHLY